MQAIKAYRLIRAYANGEIWEWIDTAQLHGNYQNKYALVNPMTREAVFLPSKKESEDNDLRRLGLVKIGKEEICDAVQQLFSARDVQGVRTEESVKGHRKDSRYQL